MGRWRKLVAVGLITGTAIVGGASAAYAAVAQGRTYSYVLSRTGVQFGTAAYPGHSTFLAQTNQHGGMWYRGWLYDTVQDGYVVKSQAKVEGYAFGNVIVAGAGGSNTTYVDQVMWDGAALYVSGGQVQACVVRPFPLADVCSTTASMFR